MAEPTQRDLLEAIKESLEKEGLLAKLKAQLRSNVMAVLNKNSNEELPQIPEETKFINELIREYLIWNGYLYSEKVLCDESGQTNEKLTRDILTTKLGVIDDSKSSKVPLLYYIIFKNIQTSLDTIDGVHPTSRTLLHRLDFIIENQQRSLVAVANFPKTPKTIHHRRLAVPKGINMKSKY